MFPARKHPTHTCRALRSQGWRGSMFMTDAAVEKNGSKKNAKENAKETTSKPSNAALAVPVEVIALDQIDVDFGWNCRFGMRTTAVGPSPEPDGDPDAPGLEGIAASLEERGQIVPVDIRPNPKLSADPKAALYSLVAGFRRAAAVEYLLAHGKAVAGLEKGQIRVLLHPTMTEEQARERNGEENLVRRNLTTPDLAYHVMHLLRVNPKLTAAQLAVRYAVSDSHMAAIVKVVKYLHPSIFGQWRENPLKPLPIVEMVQVASAPKAEQDAAYQAALAAYHEGSGGGGATDTKKWLKVAVKKARDIGTIIGTAHRKGLLVFDTGKTYDDELVGDPVRVFVKFRTKIAKRKVSSKKVAEAFIDAFVKARDLVESEEEDDDAEFVD